MYRCTTHRPTLLTVLVLGTLTACSGGSRTPPSTAPTPSSGTSTARAGAMALPISEAYDHAVAEGTRTHSGAPGPRYWQQWADYRLEAELNPVSKRITGKGTVTYYNRSPDTLRQVYVQLLHNIFAPNAKHDTDVPWAIEGVELGRVTAQGQELKPSDREGLGYQVDGTIMR
ncbi:MAG TPA: hypothetical protein VFX42_07860, partial [Gemmatimonadales bacterium]|nr:hypothetical protein [Gemmatimonadales bacterium]